MTEIFFIKVEKGRQRGTERERERERKGKCKFNGLSSRGGLGV